MKVKRIWSRKTINFVPRLTVLLLILIEEEMRLLFIVLEFEVEVVVVVDFYVS